ncbi:MAG TPA: AMP-binding protein [Acidimicrobiales bacterium]|nr:AMP-binding protein [Acidimicrobiales bacterium]
MPELVAIALPTGPRFVAELERAWHDGDAVLPLDPRLPAPAARRLLDRLRPSFVVDASGDRAPVREPAPVPVREGDALVVATSGTTGEPKGVVLTHEAVRASALATSAHLRVDPAADCWLAVLPVAHIGGLAVVTRALTTGTPLTFDVDDPRATLTAMVPTQLERHDTRRFRVVLAGGSADWRDRPANVVHTYGMTESGSGVVYDGAPLEGVDVQVAGDGEVSLRAPMLLRAYRDGTTEVDPKSTDGWFATGDEGAIDDGRLVVHGRRGDVVVTGGEKVWPAPIEATIRAIAGVADAAVGGVTDPEWGQRVVAWVVPARDCRPPTLEDIRAAVKATHPAYAAPRQVVLLDRVPRTPGGKIRRSALPSAETC